MTSLEKNKRFYSLVILIPLTVAIIWILVGVFAVLLGFDTCSAFNTAWNEDFEEYDLGLLYEKAEKWDYFNTSSDYFWVSDTQAYHGTQSGYVNSVASSANAHILYQPDRELSSGVYNWEMNFKNTYWDPSPNWFNWLFYSEPGHFVQFKILSDTDDTWILTGSLWRVDCLDGSYIEVIVDYVIDADTKFVKDVWSKIFIEVDFNKHTFKLSGNNGSEDTDEACFWFNNSEEDAGLNYIDTEVMKQRTYFDFWNVPEKEALVWGSSPASETEIIDLNTLLKIEYEGLENYDSLYVALQNKATGIFTEAKAYDIIDIGGSGEKEINLLDFNIEKNGNWHLHAVATYEGYQYEGGYFLSGFGSNWTGDLTDGNYYLDINIDGYQEIFVMSDFETWYGENAKFDEPTALFGAIAGFFDPIFSVIGEFGNRIVDYFEINEAYGQGYEIGRTIAYFKYFTDEVSLFFGGFPVLM